MTRYIARILLFLFLTHSMTAFSALKWPSSFAVFVSNKAEKSLDRHKPALEDHIISQITEKGFSLISPDVIMGTRSETPGFNYSDQSILNLSRIINADFAMVLSITSFQQQDKAFEGYGVKTINTINTIHVSYKILEIEKGGVLFAGTVSSKKIIGQTENMIDEPGNFVSELLKDCAIQIAAKIEPPEKRDMPTKELVEIEMSVIIQNLKLPEIIRKDGEVTVGQSKIDAVARGVSIEIDGILAGTAPGKIRALPGLHKLRLSKTGFKDVEKFVNMMSNQTLEMSMEMDEEGYSKYKELFAWVEEIKREKTLTDAEAKKLEGLGEFYRNSKGTFELNSKNAQTIINVDQK